MRDFAHTLLAGRIKFYAIFTKWGNDFVVSHLQFVR